jgi:hypothetical protein
MATLLVLVLVAVALVVVGLRALMVALDALHLSYRLSLAAQMQRNRVQPPPVSEPVPVTHSTYAPIKVLYTPRRAQMEE